jgi:hypothetical protein
MNPTHPRTRPPERQTPEPGVTYYRRDGVSVIGRWMVIGDHRYAVEDIQDVRRLQTPRDAFTANAGTATAVVLVAILLAARHLDAAGWLGAAVILAVPALMFAIGLWRRPVRREVWADYHGNSVRLLSTPSEERCNQLYRALLRARKAVPATA